MSEELDSSNSRLRADVHKFDKRKATVMASTIVEHTLPLLPSVRQPKLLWVTLRFSFTRLSHASRSRSRKCLRSVDISMISTTASRPQKRTQTGASSNLHFTCFIFQYISLGFSIFQQSFYSRDSEGFNKEQSRNNQRTERTRKLQLQSSHFGCSKFIFLHVFMLSQLVYRNI